MASNPMQKKSRNSFLTGMLLMLIIAAVAMVAMFMFLKKGDKKQEEQNSAQTYVYVVNKTILSGGEITEDDLKLVLVNVDTVPKNAYGTKDNLLENLYLEVNNNNGEIEYLPRYKAKIELAEGTILNDNMLYEGDKLGAGERIQEYNMLQLPIQLEPGEYVDIRLQMSNGQDYIVVSHKEVKDITAETIWLQLSEQEILLMSNAMVESYISPASNLYATKYVEPGMQGAATVTYIPSYEVINLINQNGNIVDTAKAALITKYQSSTTIREQIQNELNKYSEQSTDNIQQLMTESREKAKAEREEFLYGVD